MRAKCKIWDGSIRDLEFCYFDIVLIEWSAYQTPQIIHAYEYQGEGCTTLFGVPDPPIPMDSQDVDCNCGQMRTYFLQGGFNIQ